MIVPAARLLAYGFSTFPPSPVNKTRNGLLEFRNRLQRRDRAGISPASVSRRMRLHRWKRDKNLSMRLGEKARG